MSRIARNSVHGRLNCNTFCSGAEVAPVQCKRGKISLWMSHYRLLVAREINHVDNST